ncbi:nucleotide-binding universal stress UspA family protein [Actinoplanes octamycinicus]|uniref:Nucleotide-binding universal stress UspA family protein n=1 Tax=Actinoplanes octamycinicus TaxID=135948 RepID=A0A7W7H1N6_9ACTN|nr:universal stress protein [Actinoplanes octamycinicus]MBB4742345.1 nucleotide-binding universal stress UspA family protein [Actinoplanes octamycinicus]GIE62406.1 universal stress protein A [Actinoplanes octamycinicus]
MRQRVMVVGIDGSESSRRAAAYAVGLAGREGARLIGVYVRPLPSSMVSMADTSGAAAASVVASQDEVVTEFHDTLRRERTRSGVDMEIVVRQGDPFTELCQAANETWADAVIVGRSESLLHRIAGSVAQRLVRCGRWPVTVVP